MQKSSKPAPAPALYRTSTRRAIVELLKSERRYLSAGEIHRLLRRRRHKLALTTVYRTLQLLTTLGAVSSRTDSGGEAAYLYCASEGHHHHAICTKCGHVDEFDCRAIAQFTRSLLARRSFVLDDHALELYGRCADCR